MLGLVAILGILFGLVIVFLFPRPTERSEKTAPPIQEAEVQTQREASSQPSEASQESVPDPSTFGEQLAIDQTPPEQEQKGVEGRRAPGMESDQRSRMSVISLPADARRVDLDSAVLPPLPYCIYTGAYKTLGEARTTQSELDSNYVSAYVVPLEVEGNVAQSLFGVTQNGVWYRVLTGHYHSKEEAREVLGLMMDELPGYQPEIMRFPYALECGRFLDLEQASRLSEELGQQGFFPYPQTYPTSNGRALTRILVGCHFSRHGAQGQQQRLDEKGFDCRIVER